MRVLFEHEPGAGPSSAERRTDSRRVPLSAPFEELGARGSCDAVSLVPLANRLDLRELRRFLHRAAYLLREGGEVSFVTRDPDEYPDRAWPGEALDVRGSTERVRPLRHVLELLRLHPLRPRTPRLVTRDAGRFLEWTAIRTAEGGEEKPVSARERYAPSTEYRRFDRLEEPETADDLFYAASRLRPRAGEAVLALGVNDGRELEMFAPEVRDAVELWGIDHSAAAIEAARRRHPRHAERMLVADLADLASLDLPPIHCALALNVLQCTSVDRDRLLRDLFELLAPDARLLASLPNCHFGPGEVLRRPLRRDDPRHDRSLVFKDARFLARALFRAGFRSVETFGTLDVLLLARGRVRDSS